jgi:hypothetical protein
MKIPQTWQQKRGFPVVLGACASGVEGKVGWVESESEPGPESESVSESVSEPVRGSGAARGRLVSLA